MEQQPSKPSFGRRSFRDRLEISRNPLRFDERERRTMVSIRRRKRLEAAGSVPNSSGSMECGGESPGKRLAQTSPDRVCETKRLFFAKAIQTIPRCPTLRRQHKQQCHGGRNQVQRQGLRRTRTHVRTGVQQIEFSRKNWHRRPRLADDFRQQTRGYGCESGSGLLCAPDSPFDFVHHALGQNSSGAPESHRSLISAMGVQHHASRTDTLVGRMDGAGNEVVADRRPDQRRWRKRGCRPVEGRRNEGCHLRKGGMGSIPVGSQDGRSHWKKFVCVSTRTVDRCLRCGRKESIGGNNRLDDRRH
mmetsp:Transcript_12114/g.28338  ORF Transcript_12114/g.28338 Transcript_12114/m.28338 type:complete len:303 (+) Transcript_12114:1130-2038(+)